MSDIEPTLHNSNHDPNLELQDILGRLEERTNGHHENPKLILPPRPEILSVTAEDYKPYADVEQAVYDELELEEARRDIWQAAAERAASMRKKGPVHFYDSAFANDVESLSPIDPDRAERNFRNAQKAFLSKWITGADASIRGIPNTSPESVASLLQENHTDGAVFHSMLAPVILPMAAGQLQRMLSESAQDPEALMRFYAALKTGTEGNGGGFVLDPFNIKGKYPDDIKAAFPLPEKGALSARPHDGIFDELPQDRIIFLPFAVAGDQGGLPVTDLPASSDVYNPPQT